MKVAKFLSGLLVGASLFTVGSLFAQNVDDDGIYDDNDPQAQAFSNLAMAQELADEGIRTQSATKLIEAARIVIDNPSAPLDVTKSVESVKDMDGVSTNTADNGKVAELNAVELLEQARKFAKGDQQLLATIEGMYGAAQTTLTRAAVNGPYRVYERVNAMNSDVFTVTFVGRKRAEVLLHGDGDSNLDLFIYDEKGNLIRSNTGRGDKCRVVWYPKWTGKFRIQVQNKGKVFNEYVLMVN